MRLPLRSRIDPRELGERRDAHPARREPLPRPGRRERCGRDREDLARRAQHLAEPAGGHEVDTGGVVADPEAGDLRASLVELRGEVIPDRRTDPAAADAWLDGEAHEVTARLEARGLVVDLAV